MEVMIKMGGVYSIGFIVFHLLFWKLFNWSEDLKSLSFLNRAIMLVVNLSLTFVFFMFAFISLLHSQALLESSLGHSLLILIAVFWLLRAVAQVVFFKLKHWGSTAFLVVFLLGSVLYGVPAMSVL